jgi:hypothetical protein
MSSIEHVAADGLTVRIADGHVTVSYAGHDDWFGPGELQRAGAPVTLGDGTPIEGVDDLGTWHATAWLGVGRAEHPEGRLDASVCAYDDEPIVVFSLRAPVGIDAELATGTFEQPCVSWPAFAPAQRAEGGAPADVSSFGYQYMEFALPTAAGPNFEDFVRWPFRPPVMQPLFLVAEVGTLMLAPLDQFHEQVIAVPADAEAVADGVRCGWHGDLESVPKGFGTELALVAGRDARDCLDRWAGILTRRAGTRRLPRGTDTVGSKVSYWTDNGAAYWYRTEGGRSVTETLRATLADLRERRIPYAAVQLDSWFYPHRSIRPFDTDEWDVPPTGLERWQAREDILPDGLHQLRDELGSPPLVAHTRHLSSDSPYVEEYDCWIDGDYAHPKGPELYEAYLDSAVSWGVETFEHDWLVECFLGVRGLRAQPGRALAWQQGVDRALAERGMTAQWCMATPADFMASTTLSQLTSIRTSGDHGYLVPPELLWAWFLYTNAMARPLGLWPFKDVFRSDGHGGSTDPGAEAALAALSGGPVGIGDALGGADRELVMRTARADGVLVAPDAPIAAIGRSFLHHAVLQPEPVVGATHTQHDAGRWSYVITMNCHDASEHQATRVQLFELGDDAPTYANGTPAGHVACMDWRTGAVSVLTGSGLRGQDDPSGFDVELGAKGWDLRVLAPLLADGRLAVIGDADRYVTAGRQRVSSVQDHDGVVTVRLAGSDEPVRLVGWTSEAQVRATVAVPGVGAASLTTEELTATPDDTGRWELTVRLPREPGWVRVELTV